MKFGGHFRSALNAPVDNPTARAAFRRFARFEGTTRREKYWIRIRQMQKGRVPMRSIRTIGLAATAAIALAISAASPASAQRGFGHGFHAGGFHGGGFHGGG